MKEETGTSIGGLRHSHIDRSDQTVAINKKPKPNSAPQGLIFPESVIMKEEVQEENPTINLVPINRKVVKTSEIKRMQPDKEIQVKGTPVAPTPVISDKTPPAEKPDIKPPTIEDYLNSEPTNDGASARNSTRSKKSTENPMSSPMEGKWPDQDLSSSSENELHMVPVEGGRPYQDLNTEPLEGIRKQRDIGRPGTLTARAKPELGMVPIDTGHTEQSLSKRPVEGGRRSQAASMVMDKPRAVKKSPTTLKETTSPAKQGSMSSAPIRPERLFGNFVEDLKSEAMRQEYSLHVSPRGKMKVEFASQSKALIVAFEKQSLPFDRIVVKQIVPPHLERREIWTEEERKGETKTGFLPRIKKMFGGKSPEKPEKKTQERRGPQNLPLIGHISVEDGRVINWQAESPTQVDDRSTQENQVAVAAQYSIQGERNFWTVQLVNNGPALSGVEDKPNSNQNLSENHIKRTLLVLLDGLGDAIRADLIKAI